MATDSSSDRDPVERLAEEYIERRRRGEAVSIDQYAQAYPEWAEQIRNVFPALEMMERLKPGVDDRTGSFDGNFQGDGKLPNRLGEYRILREVGRGGMGVVYEAIQESLGRHVAVKMLPVGGWADAVQMERFRLEARSAARLHHPNIVPVHGVGQHGGVHYYAMQFIQGCGLDAVLIDLRRIRSGAASRLQPTEGNVTDREAALSFAAARSLLDGEATEPGSAEALGPGSSNGASGLSGSVGPTYHQAVARIGVQVAEALMHAHDQGVLHRDVKPSNILLDADGKAWVTDFGLAKVEGSDGPTRTGDVVGTLRYMAPERFDGWSDRRSDVYGLGVTLYELLTLHPPFEAATRVRLIEHVLQTAPTPPRKLESRIPRDLETIVLKAIAKEPAERYATTRALGDDLKNFLAGRPITARRSGSVERAWQWCRRNPALAGAASLAASALIAAALIALLYADRTARDAAKLKDALGRSHRLLASRNLDRGQTAFEKGEIGTGLLWMVESWRSAVAADDSAWQRAARANLSAWLPQHHRLRAVLSHAGPVDAAVFSPDGETILTGGDDYTARLWDAATGRPIGAPLPHSGVVSSAVFSPDGKIILTGCRDKSARLWDATTGQPIGSPLPHESDVVAVAFSPDGKTILTGSTNRTAHLWDAATRRPIGSPLVQNGIIETVAFSPDGKTMIIGGHGTLLWDAATGRPIGAPLPHTQPIRAIKFSPDGKTILTGDNIGAVRKWDAATGRILRPPLAIHRGAVRAMASSPDGKTILTGSMDKTAQLWDAATFQPVGPPWRHQGAVVAVAFSPDGKTMLTGSSDGTACLWDANSAQLGGPVLAHPSQIAAVAFSPDGKTILAGYRDRTARLWDAVTGLPVVPPLRHEGWVVATAFSPDGKTILTGSMDRTARLWDAATGSLAAPPLRHPDFVLSVAFSPDGKTILTGCMDKSARLWETATGRPIGAPLPHSDGIDAVAFSPDGKMFLTGCSSGTVQLWDAAARTPMGQPFPHPGCVSAAAFSPDGKTILTGCEDRMARLWDVATRTLLVPPLLHQGWVFAVAFSPDGKTVLTGSREDRSARLWDAATGIPLGPPLPHPDGVKTVAFSPDGKMFLTGSFGQARLFKSYSELPDDPGRIAAWTEVFTGLRLDAQLGSVEVLGNSDWLLRRERLEREGGPPAMAEDPFAEFHHGQAADRAVALARRYVELEPKNGSNWLELGLAQAQAGDGLAAGDALLKAEELGVIPHQQLNNGAWTLATHADPRARNAGHAVKLARTAVELSPKEGTYWNTLGAAHYRAGDWEEAVKALGRSMEIRGGGDAFDWFFLAMAHWRLGDKEKARDWYGKARDWAVKNSPNDHELNRFRDEAAALIDSAVTPTSDAQAG